MQYCLPYDTLFVKNGQVHLSTKTKHFSLQTLKNHLGYHGYKRNTQLAARCRTGNMGFQKLQILSFDLMYKAKRSTAGSTISLNMPLLGPYLHYYIAYILLSLFL